jgi:hypothetical protein
MIKSMDVMYENGLPWMLGKSYRVMQKCIYKGKVITSG